MICRRVSAPGLVLWGEKDPFASVEFGARLAGKTRARFVSFPGCSHWWQLERPDEVAAELERFWARAGARLGEAGHHLLAEELQRAAHLLVGEAAAREGAHHEVDAERLLVHANLVGDLFRVARRWPPARGLCPR